MREIKGSEAIREAIRFEMLKDDRVFLLGEDIGRLGNTFMVLAGLWEEFGSDRVIDSPLSEEAISGAAVGAALAGMRPVFEIMYIDFSTLGMDHIMNRAAKIRYITGGESSVPMVIRMQEGGRVSVGCQHSQCLEALYCHIPGLKVVMPSTPADAKGLLLSSIRDDDPVIFIEHKKLYGMKGDVPKKDYKIELGKAGIKRKGDDITIICYSYMTHIAMETASILNDKHGISCEVLDLMSISPLDRELVFKSVRKTNKAAVLHEACRQGGIGGEIVSIIQEEVFDHLDHPVLRICGPDTPVPYCPDLEDHFAPDPRRAAEAILEHFQI